MYGNRKWYYLFAVVKPYSMDIIKEIRKGSVRFTDLEKICQSRKTLSVRLRELEALSVITKTLEKDKRNSSKIVYNLTPKGKSTYEILQNTTKL